ncbi:calcium-binding protein [Herbaspirillum sp. alder98]|uniref:calcium-binding protein n=1 Tax=Herbaspirillum sp. alder98 TaxID=2913096 RepID=UPI001CD8F044|nr:calcium-binding protein [Herbaspirillum sp. alder98]MCA1326710.1 hypothetical protein [Herbaspirillum sp. alder98]
MNTSNVANDIATPAPGAPILIRGTNSEDLLQGGAGDHIIDAGAGDDYLHDEQGNNQLLGGTGNDTIVGSGVINGGPGDDVISAAGDGRGNVYQYAIGDGFDTISVVGDHPDPSGQGILQLGQGIAPASIDLVRDDNHLSLYMGANSQVTLLDWFKGAAHQLRQIVFADGTVWGQPDIAGMDITVLGTEQDDVIPGFCGNNLIHAGAGDDYVSDGLGNNIIYGGLGSDILMGRGVLDGGLGDDTLVAMGDAEHNVYFFDAGDGRDTLQAHGDGNPGRPQGTVAFGETLDTHRLWFRRQDNDLAVNVVGSREGMTIKDWYRDIPNQVARFMSGDDKILSHDKVDALVAAMSVFPAPLDGGAPLDAALSQALTPALAASWSDVGTTGPA